jgi:hypothetical protein
MRLAIQTKMIYGFLILACGVLLTDAYHLFRAPADTAVAVNAARARRF